MLKNMIFGSTKQKLINNHVFWIVSVGALFFFSMYTYVPLLSNYASELGASYVMLGIISGSYGLIQTVCRIPLGILSGRTGKRLFFVRLSLIAALLSSVVVLFVQSPITLIAARSLAGLAATGWVILTVMFTDYYPSDQTKKAIGIANATNNIGMLLAISFCGIFVAFWGMLSTFWLSAASAAVALFLSFLLPKDVPQTKGVSLRFSELIRVGAQKDVLTASILALFLQLISFSTAFSFTPLITEKLDANDVEKGWVTAIYTLTMVGGSLTSAYVSKKFRFAHIISVGFLLQGILCIALPFISETYGIYGLYVTQALLGYFRGLLLSLLMGFSIAEVAGDKKVAAMGFFQAVYGIGMTAGPFLFGLVGDNIGLTAGFIFTGAVSLTTAAGALFSLLYADKKNEKTGGHE